MLPYSHKPQIIRLHSLQEKERNRFISYCQQALTEIIPSSFNRVILTSSFLSVLLRAFPDIYYTLVTVNLCRRRLGEEYTYIAMYKQKHYEQEGVLLNKKTRILIFLMEIVSRNLIVPIFLKFLQGKDSASQPPQQDGRKSVKIGFVNKMLSFLKSIRQIIVRVFGEGEEIMKNMEWVILMVYMLDWNKHFTIIESLLGVRYAYTYKNQKIKDVSYAVQGYLLLATFIFKAAKQVYAFLKDRKNKSAPRAKPPPSFQSMASMKKPLTKQKTLCRICYDELKNKSSSPCGHIFCWSCIVKTLQISSECPVCRSACLAREVVQLRNI